MFHVVESARITTGGMATQPGRPYGAFAMESLEPGWQLFLICDDGTDSTVPESLGWEHVSVHARRGRKARTPSWKEMCWVKRLHWDAEDVVVQYHPAEGDYVNLHEHVLHLWHLRGVAFPAPPSKLVGPVGFTKELVR